MERTRRLIGMGSSDLICQTSAVEKELYLLEQVHAVLFQHDDMRSLANLDQSFLNAIRQLSEEFLRVWHSIVPLCNDEQCRSIDFPRIVIGLARIPVITVVLK